MRCANCVVVPSFWQEPYGIVAAEAVALGRKVVAFAVGGLPEACQGKATLVPPGDIEALARAIEVPHEEAGTVKAFVFVDALGWKQVEKYGFLKDLLPNRRSIEMQFGYSCTAIPTILTGERPAVHGHLAFYDWAPEKSPFKAMRFLAPLLRPRGFWWLKPGSADKVREAFKGFAGHWLGEDEIRRHGLWREDRKFGDAIFLAEAGIQFCPSDMGVKPLNGMHGFDPTDEDSLACWLSTVPVPDGVHRVCDYFREMVRR